MCFARWTLHVSDKLQFVATSFLVQGLRILAALIMARLLAPEIYGIVALTMAIPSVLTNLGDMGVARSIVHFRDSPRQTVEDSGLVICLVMGLLMLVASSGAGAYLARIKGNPHLLAIGGFIGLAGLLGQVYQFQMACLNRDLQFRQEAWQNLLFSMATITAGITIALLGGGVYALVLQPLVAQVVANLAIQRRYSLRWPRQARWAMAKRMLVYGWWLTLAGYVNNLQGTLLGLWIGFRFGTASLGIYGRGTQIRDMAGQNVNTAFDRLLYPLLVNAADDKPRMQSLFIRGLTGSSLICVFGWATMTALAPDLVFVGIGRQWGGVPPVLVAVAPWLLIVPFGLMASVAANVLGRPKALLAASTALVLAAVPALVVTRNFDLSFVGASITAASAAVMIIFFWKMGNAMRIPRRKVIARHLPIWLAGAIAFLVMRCGRQQAWAWLGWNDTKLFGVGFEVGVPSVFLVMAILTLCGLVAYGAVNALLGWNSCREVVSLLRLRRAML